jgi:hypothetical protein
MNFGRRIGTLLAGTVAAAGMASALVAPASAAPATGPGPRGPQVDSPRLPSVDAGRWERVNVWFRGTDRPACDFKMVVRDTRQVDVAYPQRRRYASLNTGSTLARGERDRAIIRVRADVRRDTRAVLAATVSFNNCGPRARTQFKRFGLLLPIDADRRGGGLGQNQGKGDQHKGDQGKIKIDQNKDGKIKTGENPAVPAGTR